MNKVNFLPLNNTVHRDLRELVIQNNIPNDDNSNIIVNDVDDDDDDDLDGILEDLNRQ